MVSLSQFSDLVLATSALITAVGVTYALTRFFGYQGAVSENLKSLKERKFHSEYTKLRRELEAQIADLAQILTDTQKEFSEVNHLVLEAQHAGPRPSKQELVDIPFLKAMGVDKVDQDDKLIFVLTPFHPREQLTYAAIVQAFSGFDVRVRRGDEQHSDLILGHILEMIATAKLIIANISSRNPNVMYELGFAHALGKPVIIVSSTKDKPLPFDLAGTRVLFYNTREDLILKLQEEVARRYFS